ncbi:hypothetical protein FACS1894142_8520 [Spirochaetia bacterium]|nr:hypothetical protein FACS1894142_8520 [Spirochaetia bacterium]GHU58323.1 hypothetical protein FACS189444_1810 [Spirochaetia bacterium]
MELMTLDEKLDLVVKSVELKEAGQLEEADRVQRMVPIAAPLAKFLKENFGSEFLIQNRYNLSEAEAEYGTDWLTR